MSDFALRDGRVVTVRQIRPDDGPRLREAHGRLSTESRYRRFMSSKPQLSTADTRYLVNVDGVDHFALVATVAAQEAGNTEQADDEADDAQMIIAVARFVRTKAEPEAAEFAIVVGDSYQRQGLATELMARLAQAAVERGVRRFRATMFSDNVAVVRLMEALAVGELRCTPLGPISDVEIDLPGRADVRIRARTGDERSAAPAIIAACPGC